MKSLTTEEARAFSEDCCKWKDYKSIEDYIEDVVTLLVYSPWHYGEAEARGIVNDRKSLVEHYFKGKKPADDCAADCGYFCG